MKKQQNIIDKIALKMSCVGKFFRDMNQEVSDDAIISEIEAVEDLELTDQYGRTLLHNAVLTERFAVVEYLVTQGAKVNTHDAKGNTPLHFAAQRGNVKLIDYLIKQGAEVNAVDSNGNTPIPTGRIWPIEVYEILVDNGVDPTIKNNFGVSAMDAFAAYPDIIAVFSKSINK